MKEQAAINTLMNLGYTYHGGELWKPPLGQAPDFDLIDSLRSRLESLEKDAAIGALARKAIAELADSPVSFLKTMQRGIDTAMQSEKGGV